VAAAAAVILHANQAGAGRPVVLLHGLFGAAKNFSTVQRALAQNYRVIALDLRNHGSSPHEAGMGYDQQAEDVLATLHALDAVPCALVGHSMGGKTAMRVALRAPDTVERLVVSDIAPAAYPPAFRDFATAMAALDLAPGTNRAALDAALARTVENPAVRGFLLQNVRLGAAPSWQIGLAEITAGLPDIEGWPDPGSAVYAGPTLFVTGERSDYVRPEHRGKILAGFPAARFAQVKNAGHWVHADNQAGFLAVVSGFLDAA
jgi:pimeloyl-ACP methyl ester carboxylesterase